MKKILTVLIVAGSVTIISCGGGDKNHDHSGHKNDEPKTATDSLYSEVMAGHDEVMPKMDEIMKLKRELQEQIANTPDMVIERKEQLEKMISNLDSASTAMMNWMHEFNPLPDTTEQEKAREYLEGEMERIRNVKTLMLETIEKARETKGKE